MPTTASRIAAPDPPTYGDCWEGAMLNRLVPLAEKFGLAVVPGSLDHSGFDARDALGRPASVRLVRPGRFRVVIDGHIYEVTMPADSMPVVSAEGDNFPVVVHPDGTASYTLDYRRPDGAIAGRPMVRLLGVPDLGDGERHEDLDDIDRIVARDWRPELVEVND